MDNENYRKEVARRLLGLKVLDGEPIVRDVWQINYKHEIFPRICNQFYWLIDWLQIELLTKRIWTSILHIYPCEFKFIPCEIKKQIVKHNKKISIL